MSLGLMTRYVFGVFVLFVCVALMLRWLTSLLKVLKGINLKINPGEVIAFVGPSGSGKSSIIRLLQRLVCQIEILNKLLLILLTAYTTQMMEK